MAPLHFPQQARNFKYPLNAQWDIKMLPVPANLLPSEQTYFESTLRKPSLWKWVTFSTYRSPRVSPWNETSINVIDAGVHSNLFRGTGNWSRFVIVRWLKCKCQSFYFSVIFILCFIIKIHISRILPNAIRFA